MTPITPISDAIDAELDKLSRQLIEENQLLRKQRDTLLTATRHSHDDAAFARGCRLSIKNGILSEIQERLRTAIDATKETP